VCGLLTHLGDNDCSNVRAVRGHPDTTAKHSSQHTARSFHRYAFKITKDSVTATSERVRFSNWTLLLTALTSLNQFYAKKTAQLVTKGDLMVKDIKLQRSFFHHHKISTSPLHSQ